MALFKNMSMTYKGMALYAKAQAGQPIVFTKMQVGSGDIGTQNPAALTSLVNWKLDVPISSISPNTELKNATIVGNINNRGLTEAMYICEIGVFADDPDEGEILYGYSNSGDFGDYYAPESQGPYSWQYQISVAIGNAANVTVELTELNFDYGLINSNTSFMVLSGGNQKEINKSIDTNLKNHADDMNNHIGTSASITTQGHVRLNNTVTSTSTTEAATANSVKTAYDEAMKKLDKSGGIVNGSITATGKLYSENKEVAVKADIDVAVKTTKGSYLGTGLTHRHISLGFKPKLVKIFSPYGYQLELWNYNSSEKYYAGGSQYGGMSVLGDYEGRRVHLTNTGFYVGSSKYDYEEIGNKTNILYEYWAIS